jgi:hypothetical protein
MSMLSVGLNFPYSPPPSETTTLSESFRLEFSAPKFDAPELAAPAKFAPSLQLAQGFAFPIPSLSGPFDNRRDAFEAANSIVMSAPYREEGSRAFVLSESYTTSWGDIQETYYVTEAISESEVDQMERLADPNGDDPFQQAVDNTWPDRNLKWEGTTTTYGEGMWPYPGGQGGV